MLTLLIKIAYLLLLIAIGYGLYKYNPWFLLLYALFILSWTYFIYEIGYQKGLNKKLKAMKNQKDNDNGTMLRGII